MNNEELKPCPFCGGEAEVKRGEIWLYNGNRYDPMNWNGWIVSCKNCKHAEEGVEKSEAIAAWNSRNYLEKQNSSNLTYEELEKMVKPLKWKYAEKRESLDVYKDWKSNLFFNFYQFDIRLSSDNFKALYLHDGHGHTIPLDAGRKDVEYYKHTARRFLVDLVADALGVERIGE